MNSVQDHDLTVYQWLLRATDVSAVLGNADDTFGHLSPLSVAAPTPAGSASLSAAALDLVGSVQYPVIAGILANPNVRFLCRIATKGIPPVSMASYMDILWGNSAVVNVAHLVNEQLAIQYFESLEDYVAWLVARFATATNAEPVGTRCEGISIGSAIFMFNAVDLLIALAAKDPAHGSPLPLLGVEDLGANFSTPAQGEPLRALAMAFATIFPGLEKMVIEFAGADVRSLAQSELLCPATGTTSKKEGFVVGRRSEELFSDLRAGWNHALAFELAVERQGSTEILQRGFLVPGSQRNHYFDLRKGPGGQDHFSYSTQTGPELASSLAACIQEGIQVAGARAL